MSKRRRFAYLALFINTLVWGAAAPIVKPALSFITPTQFLFYRFLLATILTLPVAIVLIKRARLRLKDIGIISALELIGTTLILWLTYTSLSLTSAIEASLIYSTAPVFVTLAGIFFLKERETKTEWNGLILAMVGTIIITVGPMIQGGSLELSGSLIGNALMFLQNIIWAGYLVFAKRIYRRRSKLMVTAISFWIGVVSFFLLALPSGNPLTSMAQDLSLPSVLFSVLFMALFGSIIGATTYLIGQNLIEISEASIFTYLQPVVAIPLSILLLQESLSPITVLGMAVIGIGVYLSEFRRS